MRQFLGVGLGTPWWRDEATSASRSSSRDPVEFSRARIFQDGIRFDALNRTVVARPWDEDEAAAALSALLFNRRM